MSAFRTVVKLLLLAAVSVLLVLLLRHWMAAKQYVFNKEDVAKLAKQYAGEFGRVSELSCRWFTMRQKVILPELFIRVFSGQDHEQAFSKVVVELRKRYVDTRFTHLVKSLLISVRPTGVFGSCPTKSTFTRWPESDSSHLTYIWLCNSSVNRTRHMESHFSNQIWATLSCGSKSHTDLV